MKLEQQDTWTIELRNLKGLLPEESYEIVKAQIKEKIKEGTLKVTYPKSPDDLRMVYASSDIIVGKVTAATDTELTISLDDSERSVELKKALVKDIAGKFDAVRRIACYDDTITIKSIDIVDFENSVLNVEEKESKDEF